MDAFRVDGGCWWTVGAEEQLTCRQCHGKQEWCDTGEQGNWWWGAARVVGTAVACGGWLPRPLGSAAGTQLCLSRPSRARAGWREQLCWQPEMGLSWVLSGFPSSSWIDVSKHHLTAGVHRDWKKCKCSYSPVTPFICRGSTGHPAWTLSYPRSGAGANPALPRWLEGDSCGSRGLQWYHQQGDPQLGPSALCRAWQGERT